ncbi:hypothetical protein QR680_012299 [Steinernema hermaphroditum]|uniref:SHSP domain-containing protein n=1 Tax=Steinernema hermaphroditum TaxID=289476 RepID=A0AA39M0I2_9BILA|nr:hypothetical protein QR680_012299 [Steinernema hermaphroditum]
MDTVPYDFVVSLMRLRLVTFRCAGLKSAEKLGRNYGTIAAEIAKKYVRCEIIVPGLFSDETLSSNQSLLLFKEVLGGKIVNFDSIAEAQDILWFAVAADELQDDADGFTHRRFLKLIQLCRYARLRHLIIGYFPPQQSKFQLKAIPNATSFFNCVTLTYQVDSPLFRDVLIAFSRTQKLEHLKIYDHDADSYYLEPSRSFSRPSESPPPEWLHDVLLTMFYQPQLMYLELNFTSVNVKRPCKDLSLLMSMKHRGRPQVDPSKLSASGARARKKTRKNKAKRLFVQAIQSVVKQHWTELSPELQEECVFIIKPNAIAENSPSGHLTLRNPFGPIDEMANEMYLANERLNAAPSIQRPLLDEEDRNLTESFSGLPPGQAEVYDDSISASQQDVLQRDVSSDNDQDLDLLRNYLEENISYSEFMQNMFPESTSDTLLQETGEEENAKEGCDSAVHIVKFTESAIHPTLTAALTKKKILLEIVCPKMCVSQKLRWLCQECKTPVYYGFDYLHCSCGAHSRTCASYRCGHESHGDEFVPLMDSDRDIREIGDCEEINIVLLGEVGAGKSTLINSIFNYLAYKNLEEAANSELKIPIPTSFLLKDDKGIRQRVSVGKKSDNENDVYGETSTQRTKTYEFMHHNENKFYRVIDTPGVGDCRGIEQDKKNFEMIIQEIKKYAKIHAFCILIPAYAARLEVAVQYFIEKLLTQLNQDAAKNIVFCITKSWMNSHRFDQLNRALASHIEKVESEKNVRIALKTMYHFNNESFKFLCARQNGVSCPQLDEFATSWNMSSKNTLRLLNYVSSLEPYWTQKEDKMKEIFWNEKMNEELHLCFITFTVENLLKMQEEKKESLEIDEVLMERQGTQILESDSVEEKEHEEATYPVLTNEIMNDMYKVINSSTSTTPSKFNLHGIRSLLETLKIRNAQEEKKESLETGQVPQIVESDSVEEKEDEGTTYAMTTRKVYEESEYYVKEFEMRDGVGREFEELETWHRGTPTFKGDRFGGAIERPPFRSRETTFNDSIYSDRYDFDRAFSGSSQRGDFYEPPRPKTQLRRYYDDFEVQSKSNGFSRDDRRHQTLRPMKKQPAYSPGFKNHHIQQTNSSVKSHQEPMPHVKNHKIHQTNVKEHVFPRPQSPPRRQEQIYPKEPVHPAKQGPQEPFYKKTQEEVYQKEQIVQKEPRYTKQEQTIQKTIHDRDSQRPIYSNETYFPIKNDIRQHEPSVHEQHFEHQHTHQQPQSILRRSKSSSMSALNTSCSRPGSPQSVAGAGDIINTEHGFTIQLDARHFRPGDIKVQLTGSTLTVTGDRVEEDRCAEQALRRQFSRKYAIPADIILESIKSHMTDDGFLFIRGNRKGWKETDIQVHYDDEMFRRKYRKTTTMSSKSSVISNV